MDKNVDLSVKHEIKFPRVDEFEMKKKDFAHSLIVAYDLDFLLSAHEELNQKN